MLITLLSVVIIITGIIICKCCYKSYQEDFGTLVTIIGTAGLIIAIIGIIYCNTTSQLNYQKALQKYNMLNYRIEHISDNVVGNETLYSDIVEFNNDLRSAKYWAENPWTNWFNNQRIAKEIDYITIPRKEENK